MNHEFTEADEHVLIGTVLRFDTMQAEFFASVSDGWFSLSYHQSIVRVARGMYADGSVYLEGVRREMDRRGTVKDGDWSTWLAIEHQSAGAMKTYRLKKNIALLQRGWRNRHIAKALELASQRLQEGLDVDEVLTDFEEARLETAGGDTWASFAIQDFAAEEMNRITAERSFTEEVLGIPTGIPALDRATTGLRNGEYTVIGASPSRGKTSLLLQCAYSAAVRNIPALVVSLEMRKEELLRRLIAIHGRLPFRLLRDARRMNLSEHQHSISTVGGLAELPLRVVDDGSLNSQKIAAGVQLDIKRFGIKVVFVDFMQIVSDVGRDQRDVINRVSASLRSIAKRENIPVIAASQLSRSDTRNINEKPNIFRLRESGNIEQDAHNVWLLHRPVDIEEAGSFTGIDEIIIGKQRHGPCGSIHVKYSEDFLIFEGRQ